MNESMSGGQEQELVRLTRRLLEAIAAGDWDAYLQLTADDLTAFEPEGLGQLVCGLPFHKFYFELGGTRGPHAVTLSNVHVRTIGADAAVVSYVRLIQRLDANRQPQTTAFVETRVWRIFGEQWKQVHFHRSKPTVA